MPKARDTKTIVVYCSEEEHAGMATLAKRDGRSVSNFVLQLVRAELDGEWARGERGIKPNTAMDG